MSAENKSIKRVIAVMSGKGGVGKSSITSLLGVALRKKGYRVGILDADITGPSIPRMFGLKGKDKLPGEGGIPPVKTNMGIEVMSLNLLLPNEDEPVIWRGPILANVVKQFWNDVTWGELDYLLVDLPPGTGDIPLTVMQTLPLDGLVVVTSPQSLVGMIVRKALNMAAKMKKPVLGLIENMVYVKCPDCGKQIDIFGKSEVEEMAGKNGVVLLGKLPLDLEFVKYCDMGRIEEFMDKDNGLLQIADSIVETL